MIVRDPVTERPRGTAFVHFYKKEAADAALAAAYEGLTEDVDRLIAGDFDSSHPLSRTESNIVLEGRKLIVTRAIDRSKAQEVSTVEKGGKRDKRNLHLVYAGMVKEGTKEAEKYTPEELDRRKKELAARMKKLKQNPNLFVSPTRLAFRNLPLEVDEKELKKVVLEAVVKNSASLKGTPVHRVTKKDCSSIKGFEGYRSN